MLEKISSIEVKYNSWIIVLILGILSVLAGTYISGSNKMDTNSAMVFFAVGAVLILTFILTRQHVITITSDGGTKINFSTTGMKREAVMDFIDKVEKAKSERK